MKNLPKLDTIKPKNTVLIVVDMQADFYAPNGRAAKRGRLVSNMQQKVEKINNFIAKIAKTGLFIVFTKYISGPNITPKNLNRVVNRVGYKLLCLKGSGGEELSGIEIPEGTLIIEKSYYDAFSYTNLNNILKEKNIQNVLVCGVRTEVCVDATAKRAASEGYDTFIIRDLVATYDDKKKLNEEILAFFDSYYGQIVTCKQVLRMLKI